MRRTIVLALSLVALATLVPTAAQARRLGESIYVYSEVGGPNKYYFRGLLQNEDGVMLQAASTIWAFLYESENIQLATPVGLFLSIHPNQGQDHLEDPPDKVPSAWYESRFNAGLFVSLWDFEIDMRGTVYSSPNGSFSDVYETSMTLRWNDSAFWGADDPRTIFRGLAPYVVSALEWSGARDTRDTGDEGLYAEIGAAPRLHILESEGLGADWVLPFSGGSSLSNYYQVPVDGELEDQFLGYMKAGSWIELEARFLPRRLGQWFLGFGADLIAPMAEAQADNTTVDDVEFIIGGRSFGRF